MHIQLETSIPLNAPIDAPIDCAPKPPYKTAIASLLSDYVQCCNPISYSGHPRGSKNIGSLKYGAGVHEGHIWPAAYWYMFLVFTKLRKLKFPETSDC